MYTHIYIYIYIYIYIIHLIYIYTSYIYIYILSTYTHLIHENEIKQKINHMKTPEILQKEQNLLQFNSYL